MYEPNFRFYDNRLWEAVKAGNPHVHMFFRLLALCHTVMPEDKDGMLYTWAYSFTAIIFHLKQLRFPFSFVPNLCVLLERAKTFHIFVDPVTHKSLPA